MSLVMAILNEIDRQGKERGFNAGVLSRQMNACVKAANAIVKEFAIGYQPSTPGMGAMRWAATDDVGMSSQFMHYVLGGGAKAEPNHPHDPSDFGRCLKYLAAVTERERKPLSEMAKHGAIWSALVTHWDEFEKLHTAGNGPGLFDKMKAIGC